MTARPKELVANDYGQRATQWFIVSDLGLTAYSGHGGVDVFIHSLASADPDAEVEVRLMARDNEVLATKKTDKNGFIHFAAGLTRGQGGQSPAAVVATLKGDYAFLNLKSAAFDLSDRGVGGRQVPAGLDAFVYTERGVYRTGETVHVTTLLRNAQGVAATGAPLTLVMQRPDGVQYRRAVVRDGGLGGRSWDVPIIASAMTGTWRVAAYTDPKQPPVGQTTFMVEDYVPDRIQFDLSSNDKAISQKTPAQVSVDGHFLYGAPASKLDLSGAVTVGVAKERPGFDGYSFGLADDQVTSVRQELGDLPETDAKGQATFPVALDKLPQSSRPLQATVNISMSDGSGRAVERQITLPVTPTADMIGVKPLFKGSSLSDGANADFDVIMTAPDGQTVARKGLKYELLKIETSYQWYRQNGQWSYEPIKRTERVANGTIDTTAGKPARLSLPLRWGRYRLQVETADPNGPITSLYLRRRLLCGVERRHAGPAGNRARQRPGQERRHCRRGGDRAHRRPPDGQRLHRQAGVEPGRECQSRHRSRQDHGRQGLGHRRLCGRDFAPAARRAEEAHARPCHRGEMVRHRPRRAYARHAHGPAGQDPSADDPRRAGEGCRLQGGR